MNILKEALLETTSISFGCIKDPLGIEKRSGGMMMLSTVLVRSGRYGRSETKKTRKRLRGLFIRLNLKQKGKNWETLCERMIRNLL